MNTSTAHGRPPAEPRRGPRQHRRASRVVGAVCVAALVTSGAVAFALPASASPGQSVTSLRDLEAEDLAATIAGRGITVRSAVFSGNDVQAGRFAGLSSTGLARGVALTTGSVIDADPQGNTSTALNIEHHAEVPSMYEVLVESAPLSDVVQDVPDMERLQCAPATINLSGAEIELVALVARENRLRTAIRDHLEEREAAGLPPLDYVLIDCPPSLGLLTVNALVAAREVMIPIQAEYYALEGLTLLLNNIDLIRQHLNPELVVSTILLTMYDARTRLAAQVAQDVRDHFPDQTLETTIPRSVRISEAPSYGQTVLTYDPGSSVALAYRAAAFELNSRPAP